MKSIDITTSQNVTITYPLASVWERMLALLLDVVIMFVGCMALFLFLKFLIPGDIDVMIYIIIIPLVVLYSLMFELFNHGQSLGKKVFRIRVIRLDGEKTGFFDYFMRWIFRGLDIYFSLGGVAILSIVASNYNQRLGDLLANTVVVSIGKDERLSLNHLLKLGEMIPKEITYPQVIRMPESAMILLKETLSRRKEFDNDEHQKAFELLVRKMEKELEIKAPADKQQFLRVLLQDYIALTR